MYFDSEEQAIAFVQESFPNYDLQEVIAAVVESYNTEYVGTGQEAPCAWWDGGLDDEDLREWVEELLDA